MAAAAAAAAAVATARVVGAAAASAASAAVAASTAGGGGDGDGNGGEGVDVGGVGVGGGGVGGGVAASAAATVAAGWRRGSSARGRNPAAGGAYPPAAGTRHEESNLEPRQLGAAGADHHRGRSALSPCQAAPPHGQPGQAAAERAAQRRWPNGGVRPEGYTFDSWVIARELPNSGTAPRVIHTE